MNEPEIQNEAITPVIEPLAGLSRKAGMRKENLFVRLARQREEYFADIGEDAHEHSGVESLPTHRYSAFLQAVALSLTPMGMLPLEEQPTALLQIAYPVEPVETPCTALPLSTEGPFPLPHSQSAVEPVLNTSDSAPEASLEVAETLEEEAHQTGLLALSPFMQEDAEQQHVGPVYASDPEDSPFEKSTKILEEEPVAKSTMTSESLEMSAKPQIARLLKSSGVYALASLVAPFVTMVLAPFLTGSLTRNDYGVLTILNTSIALLAGFSQLGLGAAFFRVYTYEYETRGERLHVLSTTLMLLLICTLPVAGLIFLLAPWLAQVLLNDAHLAVDVQLAALVVLLQNLTIPGLAWLRAESRAGAFACVSIANVVTNLSLTLLLVGGCHLGISGALFATSCGYAGMLLGTLPRVFLQIGKIVFNLKMARALLSFGLPNALSFVAAWLLQLADRFLLAHMRSLAETATYSVAYTLGGALSVVVLSPFALAWPSTLFLIAKRKNAPQVFRMIFRWYSLCLLFMAYTLSLASLFVLKIFFPPTYQNAANVIPLVTLSTMFYGLYNYLTLGMNIRRKIWFAVLFISLAALVNIGANVLLIPAYGSLGAALATLIAYILLAMLTYLLNQRIYPVPFDLGLFLLALGLTVFCYLGSMRLTEGRPFWAFWGIHCGLLFCCGIGLFALGWFKTMFPSGASTSEPEPVIDVSLPEITRSQLSQ